MYWCRQLKRCICSLLAIAMFSMSIQSVVYAEIVTTADLVQEEQIQHERDRINEWMARDDVGDQLTALGVDVDDAQSRVDNMTEEEVMVMAAKMDEMPVGSGALELVVIGALILIILELTGVTDILTFV